MRSRDLRFLVVVLACAAAACAGGQGRRVVAGGAATTDERVLVADVSPPVRITVAEFAADPGAVKPGSGLVAGVEGAVAERPGLLGGGGPLRRRLNEDQPSETDVVDLLAASILKGLDAAGLGIPAFRLPAGAPLPPAGWLVAGRILSVDPGNRAERAVVGFGAGEATAEVAAQVEQLTPTGATPILQLGVDADSGKMPGGVVAKNPYAMAAKFVIGRKATDKDIEKLGTEIANQVAAYARQRAAAPR